ncbi:MAG: SPOR domain-containing protein [Roseovarius gahaiensis]
MKVTRVLAIAVIAASVGVGFVQAQSMASKDVPAEFPPSSFEGRQYIDSKGCVFIRAGIDGNTSWIPRMTRSREVLCGFQPSIAKAKPAAEPAQPAARKVATSRPEKTTQPAPSNAERKRAPAPATAPARKKPIMITRPRTARTEKPQETAPAAVKTVKPVRTAPSAPAKTEVSSCQGGSAISTRYMGSGDVRCGPQTAPHVTYVQGGGGSGATTRPARVIQTQPVRQTASANTHAAPRPYGQTLPGAPATQRQPVRVVPRHVYENQQNAKGTYIPDGYKPVWDDDRLNPQRAHQTLQGMAQMEVAWSKTVPRYLIDRRTGRDITYKYPGLQYPYTSFEQQRAAGVTISTRGQVVPDPVRVTRGTRSTTRKVAEQQAPRAVVSTRSKAPEKAASHRYIQIGVFADRGQAQRAAQKVAARGLPARLAKMTRGGKSYTVMTTGPFRTQSDLQTALTRVRGAGFSNARLRN